LGVIVNHCEPIKPLYSSSFYKTEDWVVWEVFFWGVPPLVVWAAQWTFQKVLEDFFEFQPAHQLKRRITCLAFSKVA
jgi:hypothetical protein